MNPTAVHYPIIRTWIVKLVDQDGLTSRSVNRKIASLKAYFRFLQKVGEVEISPLAKHRALKAKKNIQVPFSEEELAQVQLLLSGSDFESLRDRLVIELFYGTGMRRSELINLTWADVNLATGTLKVLGKRNKERLIPILSFLRATLIDYRKACDEHFPGQQAAFVILTNTGKKSYDTLIYRTVNHYFKQVSLKAKTSPHLLRHTFATHLLNNGAELNSVKELLGHANLAATQIYTHVGIKKLQDAHKNFHPRDKDGK